MTIFPIISYIILNGKCSKCNSRISKQYIIIEFLSGFFFYIIFNNLHLTQSLLLAVVFSCYLILGAIDYRYFLIPKNIIIILFLSLAIKPFIFDYNFIDIVVGSTVLTLYLGLLILLIGFVKKNYKLIGQGDILLIIIIGGWLGLYYSFICLFLASFLVIVMTRISMIKDHVKDIIPF